MAGGQGQSQSQSDNKQNSAMSDVNQASPQQNSKASAPNNISGMPTAKLGDLADITVGDVRTSISKTNGKDAVNLQITKAQDANTVQVAKDVQRKIDTFVDENKDFNVTKQWILQSLLRNHFIRWLKSIIRYNRGNYSYFAVLRNIRTTAISIISIPLSLLMALIALKLSDVSLNILTLGALTVAIGRVIDDSIVVVENIYRRLTDSEEQLKGENLIISATTEVFKPIMSSTLVTIIVFYHLCLYQVQ